MGKVSDVAKNKVKSVVLGTLKAALPYILIGVGIILLITLLIGLFMVVVSGIGEIVTDIVNTMGNLFSGVGNWFASLFDPDTGKYIITINKDKFDEIKASLASQGINAEDSSLTDECLKLFILAQYKTQYPEDVRIKIEVSEEEKNKILARGRGVENEDGKYYLVTDGCIQLYRPEFNGSGKLKYITLEDLEGKIQEVKDGAKSFDYVANLYTIDTSCNLVIPYIKSKTTTWKGTDQKQEDALNLEENEEEEVWDNFKQDRDTEMTEKIDVDTTKIPYQSYVSSYTMPFEFLTILTTFTQNSEYGVAVAELVNNESSIKLQILDNSTTEEERQLYQYKSSNSVNFRVGAKAAIPEGQVWVAYDSQANDIRNYVSQYQMIWKPWNYEIWNSVTWYTRRKVVSETSYDTSIELAEADTWYVKKTNTIEPNSTTPEIDTNTSPNPSIKNEDDISKNDFINSAMEASTYAGLQNLYDTNSGFKKFIDDYYNKDTGKNGINDFRSDLLTNFNKDNMISHVNVEVTYDLWKRFYEQVLGGNGQGLTTDQLIHNIGYEISDSGHATVQQVNQYNKAVAAQDDYLNEDPNWKIDDGTYDVMPTYVNNTIGDRKIKTATYVSETKYSVTSAGKAQDNTDGFLKLLIDNNKYVEYKTTDGRKKPGTDLASAPDMLFEILASNPKTANLENAMRYIMYRMTNEDYGITDFNSAFRAINAKRVGADYSVTDKSIFITDKNKLIVAIKSLGLPTQAQQNLIDNADAFLDMQETYNVNAALAISVVIAESTAGTSREAILDFGELISGDIYCGSGNTSTSEIGNIYCHNTDEHPTQADTWISNIQASMTKILSTAGVDLSSYAGGDASGVVEFARQYVGKGIYDVLPIGEVTSDGVFIYYGDEWCAMFVSYCFDSCGLIPSVLEHSYLGCTSATQHWIDEGKMKPKESYTPKAGDIIFFGTESSRYHTGIVTDCDGTYVYTIEGNTGGGGWSGSIVKEISYPINYGNIYGYYET